MQGNEAVWYLPDENGQPAGPHTATTIVEQLRSGQCSGATLCWQRGMDGWQPLGEIEPFAGELARQRAAAKKRVTRIAAAAVLVVVLIGAGITAYSIVMGPPELRQARKLIAAGLYSEAGEQLEAYLVRKPLDHDARYLLALAQINQYVTHDATARGGMMRFGMAGVSLESARDNLSRVLTAKPGKLETARQDVAAAAARIPAGTTDSLRRTLALARLRADLNLAEKPALAAELMNSVVSSGGAGVSGLLGNQEVVSQILEWDPSLGERIVEWALRDSSGPQQDLRTVLSMLQGWARQRPALAELISSELMGRAVSQYEAGRRAEAKQVLDSVLALNPKAAATQEHMLLMMRLMDASDDKMTRCQLFLSKFPDSPDRAEVQLTVLKDAVAIFDRQGTWYRARSQACLTIGLSAAKELLERWAQTPELDVRTFELAKRLAQNNQQDKALDLTGLLLAAVPETSLRLQIEESRAQWRVGTGIGTLPPEFETLAKEISKELNIHDLTMPATLRTLAGGPDTVHVIRVTDGCTLDKFNSDETEILRQWVGNGGFLWANNDVLSLFGVQSGATYWTPAGAQECRAAVTPELCPILSGCERVVVSKNRPAACNLSHPTANVIPLLTASYNEERYTYWSLIPYGNGYVSDVKTVDNTKYDGARFWLNFQLFCLGRRIPGAPESSGTAVSRGPLLRPETGTSGSATPPGARQNRQMYEPPDLPLPSTVRQQELPGLPARITDTADLKQALSEGGANGILWVALCRDEIDTETRNDLRQWVNRGKVLWVETDLVSLFGFGGLRKDNALSQAGEAQVMRIDHPLVAGCAGRTVNYELDPNGLGLAGSEAEMLEREVLPLLLMDPLQDGDMRLVCGVCPCGSGFAVLRPRRLDGPRLLGGGSLEANLLEFSRNPTKDRWPAPAPSRSPRTRTPRGRSRLTR